MASSGTNNSSNAPPEPEVLKPQSAKAEPPTPGKSAEGSSASAAMANRNRLRHMTHRPSHKATFIGLGVVLLILGANIGVIAFIMRDQGALGSTQNRDAVTLSPATLESLGVNRNSAGNSGTELIVGPNSRFQGDLTVGQNVNIAGQLKLNSKLNASDAALTKLDAGDTSLGQLNVNGDGTITSLNLRRDLTVVGSSRLQGPVTTSSLMTVNNNLNVAGNLAIGGTLSARGFQASSLTSDTTLTIGGHIVTRGSAPSISNGGGLNSPGTVSISGNDASGTVAVNVGVAGANGTLANITFRQPYSGTPHIVVTPVGRSANVYINRSANGFSIAVNGSLGVGGYAFDYIVMQ